jgi:spermidine/putrescine transport system permease protein
MSIDDFIISYFTAGTGTRTLPLIVYAMTKRKITPKINALSTIMFITVLLLLIIVNVRRVPKKKTEERR